jgi:hypothetical protein
MLKRKHQMKMIHTTFILQRLKEEKEEKEHTDKLEQGLTTIYDCILDSAQTLERNAKEKINMISQTIEIYKKEIEELKERINPTTPPEV